MTEYCQEMVEICQKIQPAIQLAIPDGITRRSKGLSISSDITVQFPSRRATRKRIEFVETYTKPLQFSFIADRYLQACGGLQSVIREKYDSFCRSIISTELHGGLSDIEVQRQVARAFSIRYKDFEERLADVVTRSFQRRSVSMDLREENATVGTSREKSNAKMMLEKAFAVNTMPTDAERDYLATQTGMTYKQVTVWFQNNRSRRINALPKRSRQPSEKQHSIPSHPASTTPPRTASSLTSLHEIEQHLRNPTDSPLAQHNTVDDSSQLSSRTSPSLISPLPQSGNSVSESNNDELLNNSGPSIVSRSPAARKNDETRAVVGAPRVGNGDVNAAAGSSNRPIAPLRKSRLAGKKAAASIPPEVPRYNAQPPSLSCRTTTLPAYLQPSNAMCTESPVHLSPGEILRSAQSDSHRVPSSGSVSEVDSLLGTEGRPTDSFSRAVSSSSVESMLMLSLDALTGRSASSSSVSNVDASLEQPGQGNADMDGMLKMVPIFNFLPPTPSNARFMPFSGTGASSTDIDVTSFRDGVPYSDPTFAADATLQFDPIDFSALFGLSAGSGMDADTAAQNLLKDLDELDFGEFLHSPEMRRGSGVSEVRQEDTQQASECLEDIGKHEVPVESRSHPGVAPSLGANATTPRYVFEDMEAFNKISDKKIDPVVTELLKGIMSGSTAADHNGSDVANPENDAAIPAYTAAPQLSRSTTTASIISESDGTGHHRSADELSLGALAIDLSALLGTSPRGSLYMQTTPSDVSDTLQFSGTPFDELLATPLMGQEPQTVPHDVKRDSSSSLQLGEGKGEQEGDWQGLLDFSDMFEAFWNMVDEESAQPQWQVEAS